MKIENAKYRVKQLRSGDFVAQIKVRIFWQTLGHQDVLSPYYIHFKDIYSNEHDTKARIAYTRKTGEIDSNYRDLS